MDAKENIAAILEDRKKFLGHNLSISYSSSHSGPLHIVRGEGQYLFDKEGRRYLDCVNNVTHIGHCHPRVVEAASQQLAKLNTNTRYLHENIVEYAKKLGKTLPGDLKVVYFVCSGSEANELALRLARTYTKKKDIIVVDTAYHGHTTSLIDISPYKYEGPGGFPKKKFVHKVDAPDTFRGKFRKGEERAGEKYAEQVKEAIESAKQNGREIAAFICESILGCAGQMVLPENYLKDVYSYVRAAGGVCIADEVQTGFGRVGTHFWAFETQDVIPDIVTMGKPIGNGFPLAAVVTTPEIAKAFNNGMEYFNTFGGNPVSCAVGLAVLDVIEKEKLMENALKVGNVLLSRLEKLKDKYDILADVRGLGLFLGVEFVRDRKTLEPADEEASFLVNRMRENGILASTDGKYHNAIKFKPPMCFSLDDAERFITEFENALKDLTTSNFKPKNPSHDHSHSSASKPSSNESGEQTVSSVRPMLSNEEIKFILRNYYGIELVKVSEYPSYDDRNFHVVGRSLRGHSHSTENLEFVLKAANFEESRGVLEFQAEALKKANEASIKCLELVLTISSKTIVTYDTLQGKTTMVRLFKHLPGMQMAQVPHSKALLHELGLVLGQLDKALFDFHHPLQNRPDNPWDSENAKNTIINNLPYVHDQEKKKLVDRFIQRYDRKVLPVKEKLRRSIIHGDVNCHNVLVKKREGATSTSTLSEYEISGIIDFGDMTSSRTVYDLSICIAYVTSLNLEDPLSAALYVTEGYLKSFKLEPIELEVLLVLSCIRLCVSVCMCAYKQTLDPENEYLRISEKPSWTALFALDNMDLDALSQKFVNLLQ
eukprot:TRINITY_DN78_c0_g4_i1.p1 TRINITY_DN78_c0_g4~~TRINITY_DN78_c0_g4_i1.p1  ORF type:complete len:826 (+),score=219.68 TRINITY_DN78_c0_g4_i1:100-2577(+)